MVHLKAQKSTRVRLTSPTYELGPRVFNGFESKNAQEKCYAWEKMLDIGYSLPEHAQNLQVQYF